MGLSGKAKIHYNLKSGFWNEFFSSSSVLKGVLSRVKMCWHGPLLSLMLAHKHMLAHAHPCAHICTHTHSCTLSMQISFSQIVIAQIFSPSLKFFDIADMLCSHILKKQGRGWKTKRNSVFELFSVKKLNYSFLEMGKNVFKVTDNDAEKVASNFVLSRMSFPSSEKMSLSFNFEQKKLWRRMTNCQDSGETDKDKEAKNKNTLKSFFCLSRPRTLVLLSFLKVSTMARSAYRWQHWSRYSRMHFDKKGYF